MNEKPKRAEGWEERLAAFIESRRSTPFAWGSHDCCAFTAGAFRELTGCDAMERHTGYSTALGAARVLRAAGGIECIPEAHGCAPQPVALSQRGDVVAVEIDGRVSLGVCDGAVSFFASADGVTALPTATCRASWRVE
jgi:hypothetical protein